MCVLLPLLPLIVDKELEKLVFKLLQLPDGKFEDCYELEYLLPNKEWDSLLSFSDVKDGMEIRVLSKAFSKVVDLPSAAEGKRYGVVVYLCKSCMNIWVLESLEQATWRAKERASMLILLLFCTSAKTKPTSGKQLPATTLEIQCGTRTSFFQYLVKLFQKMGRLARVSLSDCLPPPKEVINCLARELYEKEISNP